jgi:hypothetical protein
MDDAVSAEAEATYVGCAEVIGSPRLHAMIETAVLGRRMSALLTRRHHLAFRSRSVERSLDVDEISAENAPALIGRDGADV